MKKDDYKAAILKEVEYWPDVRVEFQNGSKHNKAIFHYGNSHITKTVSCTGSDQRGVRNAITDVRRMLIGIGAKRTKGNSMNKTKKRNMLNAEYPVAFVLSDKRAHLIISQESPLFDSFVDGNGKGRSHWQIILRKDKRNEPPVLVVKRRDDLALDAKVNGCPVGSYNKTTGEYNITLANSVIKGVNKLNKFGKTKLRLLQMEEKYFVCALPDKAFGAGEDEKQPEPIPEMAPVAPEPVTEAQEASSRPLLKVRRRQAPVAAFAEPLAYTPERVGIEEAIMILNQARERLGDGLVFTVSKNGYLGAVVEYGVAD